MKTFIDWQATTTGKAVNGYSNMRPCRGTYTLWLSNFIFPKFHPSEGFNFETRFIIYKWPARERIFHSTFHAIFFFFFRKLLSEKKKSRPRRTKHVHHRVSTGFGFTRDVAARPNLLSTSATKYFDRVGRHMLRFLAFSSRLRSPNRWTVGRE